MKQKFRVFAESTSTFYIDIEAESQEQAIEIAKGTDGGYFNEDGIGSWDITTADEITLTLEEFIEKYKPIEKPDSPNDIMFETYDDDLSHVMEHPVTHIWTVLNCDEKFILTNGYHHVNRWGYVLATVPYNETELSIKIDW